MVSSAHALARHSNLNASEVRNIAATSCALATLSVTACALASALAWRKRKSWEMVQEVIILILATDLGFCAQYLIVAPRPGSAACYAQAVGGQFFTLASMLWSAVVADVLVRLLVFQDDRAALARRRLPYHGLVWGVSLVGTILPAILGVYGPAGPWCWIDTSLGAPQAATVMRFGTVYLGIWASIAFQIWAFTKVRVVVRRSMALFDEVEELSTMEDSRKAAVDAGRRSLASAQRLFAFPLIILIARGVGTINRIHNWVNPGDDVAALYYLQAIPLASQGWMHAVFCVSGGLQSYIMARCCGGSRAPPPHERRPSKPEKQQSADPGFVDVDLGEVEMV